MPRQRMRSTWSWTWGMAGEPVQHCKPYIGKHAADWKHMMDKARLQLLLNQGHAWNVLLQGIQAA